MLPACYIANDILNVVLLLPFAPRSACCVPAVLAVSSTIAAAELAFTCVGEHCTVFTCSSKQQAA
jgi:hypothetical protein